MQHVTQETYGGQAPAPMARRLLSCFLAFALAFALVPAQALVPQPAYGADAPEYSDDAIEEGIDALGGWRDYGTCQWGVDYNGGHNTGTMIIRPKPGLGEGVQGELPAETAFPWADMGSVITRVVVKDGVKASSSCKRMFADLEEVVSIDLSGLDTSAVTDMSYMFAFEEKTVDGAKKASKLQSIDFTGLDVSNVRKMQGMFSGCGLLTVIENMPTSTASVDDMSSMFQGCKNLVACNPENIPSQIVIRMNLNDVLRNLDTGKVTNMQSMFKDCEQLFDLEFGSAFRTGKVYFMQSMFEGCVQLESVNFAGWNTASVSRMDDMFNGCVRLKALDKGFGNFQTGSCSSLARMFKGCKELASIGVSDGFGAGNADTSEMFSGCESLIGGYGFTYRPDVVDGTYAKVNTPDTPGYFYDAINGRAFPKGGDFADPAGADPAISFGPIRACHYTGQAIEPAVAIYQGEYPLRLGEDFTVSYRNNIEQGTEAEAIIRGTGTLDGQGNPVGYVGTHTEKFEITRTVASDFTVELDGGQTSFPYTGEAVAPAVKVYLDGAEYPVDAVSYSNNVDPGIATAAVTVSHPDGDGGIFHLTAEFQIAKISMGSLAVSLEGASWQYTGAAIRPRVFVSTDAGYLAEGRDYTVSYANNTNPGTGSVTITGIGAYSGSITRTFAITGPLSKASFKLSAAAFAYDGKAKTPGVTVTLAGRALKPGTDYTVGYLNNIKAGNATARVVGKGLYTGTVNVVFRINPVSVSSKAVKFAPLVSKAYNRGRAISQVPAATYAGLALKNKTDFTVTYKNNKKLGTAKVTVKGKGNYTGTKTLSFKIVKYKQPMTAKASSKTAKYSTVKKKASTIKKCITVKKAQGKVTYANASTTSALKKFKVNAKNGAITVPKGTKKGTYKVKVKVETKGTSKYAYGSKTVTVSIKVK